MSTDSGLGPAPLYAAAHLPAAPPPLPPPPQAAHAPTYYVAQPYVAELVNEPPPPAAPPALPPAAAAEPSAADEPRGRLLTRELFYSLIASFMSAAVHFALIVLLGIWLVPQIDRPAVLVIEAMVEPSRPLEEVVQKLDRNFTPATQLSPPSSASAMAGAMASLAQSTQIAQPKLRAAVVDRATAIRIDVGAVNVFTTSGNALAASVPNGTLGEPLAAADGYDTAMDILTREILNRLSKGKVLVVWMFDQSQSMKDDQAEIAARIDKVYAELGLSSAARGDALVTGVVSYGIGFAVHTPRPTTRIEGIREAIAAIPVDESGEEMMCTAVAKTVQNFRSFSGTNGGRQMMLVMVSDESGNVADNNRSLEPTIDVCKKAQASVYVLGREAVFGYPYAQMDWRVTQTVPGVGTVSRMFRVDVDRGPETPFVELLQTEGLTRRLDSHPSGFGPYEQVRLARETGGMFLMMPSPELALFNRGADEFDIETLRPFLPDVRSRADYAHERDYSPLRAVIWKVINDLNPYKPEIARYIVLSQRFAADKSTLARELDAEMAKAKQYVLYLDAAEKALRDARGLRDREKSPRWRAHYDLILAQLVAYKARIFEYGAYLAAFKANPKPADPPTPTRDLLRWNLREQVRLTAPQITEPLIEQSDRMFEQIIADYEGTPWATRAEYELERPFGYELFPEYFNPNPPRNNRPQINIRPPKI